MCAVILSDTRIPTAFKFRLDAGEMCHVWNDAAFNVNFIETVTNAHGRYRNGVKVSVLADEFDFILRVLVKRDVDVNERGEIRDQCDGQRGGYCAEKIFRRG